jgi:hypothetical protein
VAEGSTAIFLLEIRTRNHFCTKQTASYGQRCSAFLNPGLHAVGVVCNVAATVGDTQKGSLLRHYATSREVVGSIHDETIAIFN